MASAALGVPYKVSEEGAKTLAEMASERPARLMEGFVSRRATPEDLERLNARITGTGTQNTR